MHAVAWQPASLTPSSNRKWLPQGPGRKTTIRVWSRYSIYLSGKPDKRDKAWRLQPSVGNDKLVRRRISWWPQATIMYDQDGSAYGLHARARRATPFRRNGRGYAYGCGVTHHDNSCDGRCLVTHQTRAITEAAHSINRVVGGLKNRTTSLDSARRRLGTWTKLLHPGQEHQQKKQQRAEASGDAAGDESDGGSNSHASEPRAVVRARARSRAGTRADQKREAQRSRLEKGVDLRGGRRAAASTRGTRVCVPPARWTRSSAAPSSRQPASPWLRSTPPGASAPCARPPSWLPLATRCT